MDQTELLDKTFMYLYKMEDGYIFPSAFEKRLNMGNVNSIMLLDTIHDIGFATKEKNTQQSLGASQNIYNYWLNSDGNNFIDNLPPAFNNKPYSYYRQLTDANNNLSLEKVNLEVIDLRNKVFDYEQTKSRTKTSLIWSVIASIAR